MKKNLSLLFFFLIFTPIFSQLDREHWFAPMIDRTSVGSDYKFQKLYLSTSQETAFPVSIYNNNVLIATVVISKNNPQRYDVLRNYIITTSQADVFKPSTKGLYLKADFPFYANLRFSVPSHAEIITSKGTSANGTLFYAASAPLSSSATYLNFMTSVLATEDNTQVTVSGYKNTVRFSNGMTGASNPILTFTLNKGQSYIIDGVGTTPGNANGFIGAQITSNKPVNITNGDFNGQYAVTTSPSDILMDQSVPVEKLGNEFILVKGNGSIGSNMERAFVIATEDNTQIYTNNDAAPIATLNTGQYYLVPDTKYILQGTGAGIAHYNLYLRTSKNAYVYQLLAGISGGSEVATGGMSFIPPLNCYLPKQINEIPFVDDNFTVASSYPTSGSNGIPTKLNIITERGALVTVNGLNPPPGTGPFNIRGNNNWVTYGIPRVAGTLTINSTKAVTAGINGGSGTVGYGGFFAGFPIQSIIIGSNGDCVPGIVLTVDPANYDSYQWYRNDVLIPGATGSSFTPNQTGNYNCHVTTGSCDPLITTSFKVKNCTKESTASYDICATKKITPSFSNSTQTPVPSTVTVTHAPTLGTVTIDPTTGILTYNATNPGTTGTDTFTYKFCGNDPEFPQCEIVTVTINIKNLTVNNDTLTSCNINGIGNFDLTAANITSNNPVTITYYPTMQDAQNENQAALISNPAHYQAPDGTTVYAVAKNTTGCKSIAQITLKLYNHPVINTENQVFCDDDLDGTVTVNLPTITQSILNNTAYFTNVRYYANITDANAGNNAVLNDNWSYSATTTIYIRVDSPDGCNPVIEPIIFSIGDKVAVLKTEFAKSFCNDLHHDTIPVDVAQYISQYTTDPLVNAAYFATLADAHNNVNPINSIVNIAGPQTVYIRFTKQNDCPQVVAFSMDIQSIKKSEVLFDVILCPKATTTLEAGEGFDSYKWSTGASTQSISNVGVGNYWVDLTKNECTYRQTVQITESALPIIASIDISGTTVTIGAVGGTPSYEYSLDQISWQSSNIFRNLHGGNHIIYVRDRTSCDAVSRPFVLINLINAITPNHDGYNDNINYSTFMNKNDFEFRVFDRYGTEVFKGDTTNRFTWDGTIRGRPVNTATYWYFIKWTESGATVKYTSWLLVKNR